MHKPDHIAEVTLQPGEFHFGGRDTRIATLLGSCISVTMWHPRLLIGGMCHYMLPSRKDKVVHDLDGRYGSEAILMFFREAIRHDADPNDFIVKLFGGGNMFPQHKTHEACAHKPCEEAFDSCRNVSCRNASLGISLLDKYGFKIASKSLGGSSSRKIVFDIWSGDVWMKQTGMAKPGGTP